MSEIVKVLSDPIALWAFGATIALALAVVLRRPLLRGAGAVRSVVGRAYYTTIDLRPGPWLRRHYWKVMLGAGILLGLGAAVFYLIEIGIIVARLVDRLRLATAAGAATDAADIRNIATATAVLLGAIAAAATLIFQLVRVWINERTTSASEEGLITDRINTAVAGLGAEKSVKRQRRNRAGKLQYEEDAKGALNFKNPLMEELTVPNIEVRIGALYALERIAQDSLRDHVQIMEILCAYIRENSPASTAIDSPHRIAERLAEGDENGPGLSDEEIFQHDDYRAANPWNWKPGELTPKRLYTDWVPTLPTLRTDIQIALEIIGRRSSAQIEEEQRLRGRFNASYTLDLRATNLQAADIRGLNLHNALLDLSRLDGAHLESSGLSGASLRSTILDGVRAIAVDLADSNLARASLVGSRLYEATLARANFGSANLVGAMLVDANAAGAGFARANLRNATLHASDATRASFWECDLSWANLDFLEGRDARFIRAKLAGTSLENSSLPGAQLISIEVDADTELTPGDLTGALITNSDLSALKDLDPVTLAQALGDDTVILPAALVCGEHPLEHWKTDEIREPPYDTTWADWQETIGYVPLDPSSKPGRTTRGS
ncbi:MAG: pentapeptide repeat-containing protein [Pseudomonadota bacterium]